MPGRSRPVTSSAPSLAQRGPLDTIERKPVVPHCGEPLDQVGATRNSNSWSGEYQYVCFNDDCPYFVRGWDWMREQFNVTLPTVTA